VHARGFAFSCAACCLLPGPWQRRQFMDRSNQHLCAPTSRMHRHQQAVGRR
jgi:hypothetical protein